MSEANGLPEQKHRRRENRIGPSRSFYLRKFGGLMNSLRTELIVVGLFVVLLTYAGNLAGDLPFDLEDASLAAFLLILAIAFTAYDVIAGEIFITERTGPTDSDRRLRPLIVIGLFVLELTMFIVNLGILLMPLLIVLNIENLDVSAAHVFTLGALWHFINVLWYVISPVELRDFLRHGFYTIVNAGFFAFIVGELYTKLPVIGGWSQDAMTVAGYGLVVGLIYVVQVRGYILESAAVE